MTEAPYTVKLPLFEGPLDLLLHLIQREELDITAISLAKVADQFVAYLRGLEAVQPEVITDFLVVAARLLLIKSRWLLPRPPAADAAEEEDPGEALARRLREYKRFKELAAHLRSLEQAGRRLHIRVAPPPSLETRLDAEGLSLEDLVTAFQQVLLVEPQFQPVGALVSPRKVTVADKIERIQSLFASGRPVSFEEVVGAAGSRIDIVVSLWAVLELIKRGRLRARQEELFGAILLEQSIPLGEEAS